jgi:hypothetical protein
VAQSLPLHHAGLARGILVVLSFSFSAEQLAANGENSLNSTATGRNSTIAQFRRLRPFKHPAADIGKFRH